MSERKWCTHSSQEIVVLVIRWCARCSGWHYKRVGVGCGSLSAIASAEVYESHFLPAEETTPDELQFLIQRAFRAAQELEEDWYDAQASLPFD